MGIVKRWAFALYMALNMGLCALVFGAWCEPRETVSGLMGRWRAEKGWKHHFGAILCPIIDLIYWWDADHCSEVARLEAEARKVLYGKSHP